MVVETLRYLKQTRNIEVVIVPVIFPMMDTTQIVRDVELAMKSHSNIKFAVFSHISSMVQQHLSSIFLLYSIYSLTII